MKQSQLVVAVLVLAVMVFVVTFAMNYIGGGNNTPRDVPKDTEPGLELLFANKLFPEHPGSRIELEDKGSGHQDYWFLNTNDKPVQIGLNYQNCKCTSVEVYALSGEGTGKLLGESARGIDSAAALAMRVNKLAGRSDLEGQAKTISLQMNSDGLEVSAGALGWVRLRYKGEKSGPQTVTARLWMGNSKTGQIASLELSLMYYEPLRVRSHLAFDTLTDNELNKGVKGFLYCWTSTRKELKIVAKPVYLGGMASNDPLQIGEPELLDEEGRRKLEQLIAKPGQFESDHAGGPVTVGYRIPITLQAVSPDGKRPFDIGPFRRRVMISSPDVEGEKMIQITGRVRGLVEIGFDEESGDLNFRVFPRREGKRVKLPLHSTVPGMTLEIDRSRMPEFLGARLTPGKKTDDGRQSWTLFVEVLPNKASGPFPRREAIYEDSAVYLKSSVAGKPPRYLRIAAQGTASEG